MSKCLNCTYETPKPLVECPRCSQPLVSDEKPAETPVPEGDESH